jgi:hypothetical protein
METFSIQNLINDTIKEKQEHKEKTSWWPTDCGKCLSGVYYSRLGAKPDSEFDDRTLRVFSVGRVFEEWVTNLISNKPEVSVLSQVRVTLPDHDLTGYIDVVVQVDDRQVPYEFKTVHSRKFWHMTQRGQADDQHRMQLWWYLKFLNVPEGRLVYISKDDLAIQEYPVFLNDENLSKQAIADIAKLMVAWKTKKAPEPASLFVKSFDKKKNKDVYKLNWQADYCRYHSHCLGDPNWRENTEKELKTLNKKIS